MKLKMKFYTISLSLFPRENILGVFSGIYLYCSALENAKRAVIYLGWKITEEKVAAQQKLLGTTICKARQAMEKIEHVLSTSQILFLRC